MRKLGIVIPTYNEAENIANLVIKIKEVLNPLDIFVRVLVVDDNSPDGTGEIVDKLSKELKENNFIVECLHRKEKNGLGKAYTEGIKNQISYGVDIIQQMDADLSHNPESIINMLEITNRYDVAVGSRYINGGSIVNWNMFRKLLSKSGNTYAKFVLGMPINDLTGGFNQFQTKVLQNIDLDKISTSGYGFLIELKYKTFKKGYSMMETPITFLDREKGKSKISKVIIFEAMLLVIKLRFGNKK